MDRPIPRVPYDIETRREYLDLPFPIFEYQQRVGNTRRLMSEQGLDGLIAFGDQNDLSHLTYLANFEPMIGRGAVIITADSVSLVTDSAFHGDRCTHSFGGLGLTMLGSPASRE